jgi:hypothetical protein
MPGGGGGTRRAQGFKQVEHARHHRVGVRVVVQAVPLDPAADVDIREALQRYPFEKRPGGEAVVAGVGIQVRQVRSSRQSVRASASAAKSASSISARGHSNSGAMFSSASGIGRARYAT